MTRELHRRSFRESVYERPNQDWVCGWESEGRPCPLGPDSRGRCVVTHECTPSHRGDRWNCERSLAFGGPCEEGPLPDGACCRPIPRCRPVRSLRARRGRLSRWTVAATVGFLALTVAGIAGMGGGRFLSPGPVGYQHGTIEDDCSSCHSAGVGGPAHWFSAAFFAGSGLSESERCLKCHNLGEWSLLPHGVSNQMLAQKTAAASAANAGGGAPVVLAVARLGPGVPRTSEGALACATCHKEHHGRDDDLTALSNAQCQICHQNQFGSIGEGHPSFVDYPYERRTRVRFNHLTHKGKHFPSRDRAFDCIGCHQPERTGHTMEVADFEVSCRSCHHDDVTGEGLKAGSKGVAFLSLPSLDLKSLDDPEVLPIGEWPKSKRVKPSPFMDLLLAGEVSAEDRATVAELKLGKLKSASADEKNAVVRYVWALKSLLNDLGQEGHAGIEKRLEQISGRELDRHEVTDLAGQLGLETIAAARRQWLPHLAQEVERYRELRGGAEENGSLDAERLQAFRTALAEIAVEEVEKVSSLPDSAKETWVESGGWFVLKRSYSIRYRTRGHADPFLRGWLTFSAALTRADGHAEAAGDGQAAPGPAASGVFQLLTKKNAPGRCTKCHSIDGAPPAGAVADGGLLVNWKPFHTRPTDHPPTQFKHKPHFSLEDQHRCFTCHRLKEADFNTAKKEFDSIYEGRDPYREFSSNFHPMESALCSSCHTGEAAGDACISCHNYHQGEFVPVYLTAAAE